MMSAAKPINVLLVDDSETDCFVVSELLRRQPDPGYRLRWANSPRAALAALAIETFDVAIFDHYLGEMTGIDLLENIRDGHGDLPVILLTGLEDETVDRDASRAGAADFLCKPGLPSAQLERSLRNAIRQAAMTHALCEQQHQFDLFMRHVPGAVCICDTSGSPLFQNEMFRRFFSPADFEGHFSRADHSAPWSCTTRDRHWLVSTFPMVDARGAKLFGVAAADLTEQRLLEQQLLTISDEERQRIGADLHDGLGQKLTGLALLATALRNRLQRGDASLLADADRIAQLANEATIQTRVLARGLCPVHLEQMGLAFALSDLADGTEVIYGIRCKLIARETVGAGDPLRETHLYRIAQEAVHNAIRHGASRTITILLEAGDNRQRLTIEDDGSGFALAQVGARGGLRLMEYRAALLGGTFGIESAPGRGTRITCSYPVPGPPASPCAA